MKKFFLFLFLIVLTFSCGKKSDPEYEDIKTSINYTKIKVVL